MEQRTNKIATAQPLLLSIPDVAASLGLCRSKIYELIAKEQLPVIRFGHSVRVSVAALQQWVEERERQHLSAVMCSSVPKNKKTSR